MSTSSELPPKKGLRCAHMDYDISTSASVTKDPTALSAYLVQLARLDIQHALRARGGLACDRDRHHDSQTGLSASKQIKDEASPPACSSKNAMGLHSYSKRSLPSGLCSKHGFIVMGTPDPDDLMQVKHCRRRHVPSRLRGSRRCHHTAVCDECQPPCCQHNEQTSAATQHPCC